MPDAQSQHSSRDTKSVCEESDHHPTSRSSAGGNEITLLKATSGGTTGTCSIHLGDLVSARQQYRQAGRSLQEGLTITWQFEQMCIVICI